MLLKRLMASVFYGIYTLFLLRFVVLLGEGSNLFIYTDYRPVLDYMYYYTDLLGWPVESMIMAVYEHTLFLHTIYFPVTQLAAVGALIVDTLTVVQPMLPSYILPLMPGNLVQQASGLATIPGYIEWMSLFNFLFFALLQPAGEKAMEWLNNMVWAWYTERIHQKDKDKKFTQALAERALEIEVKNKALEQEVEEKKLLKQSVVTDELTRVFNKRFFLDKVQEVFATARKQKTALGIIMVDIDHFKKLNDNYGHLMGDKVLQRVAEAAKLATPGTGFCCRFGGEEFTILLPNASFETVQQVANAIHKQLPLLRFEEDQNLRVTCSQGVCYSHFANPASQPLNAPEDMIKLADDELYKAKKNGRNRVCAVRMDGAEPAA
jgi:diguanylate cyclase (GGDEF)-like protein